jgi:hypothetical protein
MLINMHASEQVQVRLKTTGVSTYVKVKSSCIQPRGSHDEDINNIVTEYSLRVEI